MGTGTEAFCENPNDRSILLPACTKRTGYSLAPYVAATSTSLREDVSEKFPGSWTSPGLRGSRRCSCRHRYTPGSIGVASQPRQRNSRRNQVAFPYFTVHTKHDGGTHFVRYKLRSTDRATTSHDNADCQSHTNAAHTSCKKKKTKKNTTYGTPAVIACRTRENTTPTNVSHCTQTHKKCDAVARAKATENEDATAAQLARCAHRRQLRTRRTGQRRRRFQTPRKTA